MHKYNRHKLRTKTTPNLFPLVIYTSHVSAVWLSFSSLSACLSSKQTYTIANFASTPISHCIATSYGIIGMRKQTLPQRLIGADIHPNCRFQQHY
ncbi:hypothetical protein T11_2573 [Trichinella zimbabwensis]|uniref:Uncharacterized protein n=1 Tax=Trichinella zimbabwensis TaxID=268475 RepID=A0A0V1I845_9BILA|nr:hypothetical protein T11_2573 [Trichinella zimbabwensis]